MLHTAKEIRKPDLKSAISLFHDIIVTNDVSSKKIANNQKLTIFDMSQSGAWLEPWMIKTEEIFTLLTGERLFNVLYKEDERSIVGLVAQDYKAIKDLDEKKLDKVGETPVSLKYLVGELAFNQLVSIENELAIINTPSLSLEESSISGFFKPLSQDKIILISLKGYLDKTKTAILNNNLEKELSEKIRKDKSLSKSM